MKIAFHIDGSVTVLDNAEGPYHVVSKAIDPYNKYDIDEVLAYAASHPSDVLPEGSFEEGGFWYTPEPSPIGVHDRMNGTWVLNQQKYDSYVEAFIKSLCSKIDDQIRVEVLEAGFAYNSVRIQADAIAQQNATGFLTAVSAGVPVPFPVQWRTKANDMYMIQDAAELGYFAAKMMSFVQQVFHAVWNLKDQLRTLTTAEEVQGAYDAGVAQMRLIGDSV